MEPLTPQDIDVLIPTSRVADQFGVSQRTLYRWLDDTALAFPKAIKIKTRLYFRLGEIEAWKIQRVRHLPCSTASGREANLA